MRGFTIIIPAYANDGHPKSKYHFAEVGGMIKNAIESVYNQRYINFEILVCSDGDNEKIKELVEDYEDPRIKYHFVEHEGEIGGCRSQNEMMQIAEKDLIIHLDQDNTIYRNCFFRILEEWDDETGLLIFRINHQVGIIPVGEKIEHRNIDLLNGATKTSIAKQCEMANIAPSADSRYYKQAEEICKIEGYKVKFIKDILGVHN